MEKRKKTVFAILLPLLVITAAIGVMKGMVALKKPPARIEGEPPGILVETRTVRLEDRQAWINATGTVEAAAKISIIPQVSGRVVRMSPRFRGGGFFKKGEEFFTIEAIDYQLAVEKAESLVAKRRVELAGVESKAEVARREWKRLGRGEPPASSLVLYGPQLKEARANLAGAVADKKMAQLNLDRTVIKAPFACVIISEEIDPGQYLRGGNPVGVAVATDAAEVVVPVPTGDFDWLIMPDAGRSGSSARVMVPGRTTEIWLGEVIRLLADVDSRDRMIRAVVRIPDPYGHQLDGSGMPLPMGQFVSVVLAGKPLPQVAVIPLAALHDNDTVWLYDNGFLVVRRVTVARREKNEVLVASGLVAGDRVILTMITGAAPGMKLRLAEAD